MGLAAHQEEIIAQLYREMYRKLVVYAENALNDSLAEEAVQDTFRIACSKYDELMNSSNPQGWLMNTLKNVIRNIRKEQANLNKYFVMTMSLDDEEFMEVCAVGTDVHKRLEDTGRFDVFRFADRRRIPAADFNCTLPVQYSGSCAGVWH